VDLTLGSGEILGLIGPNGAGKTTLLNALSGFQRLTGGTVHMNGQTITGWTTQKRARNGLVRTFQGVRLFSGVSVLDNVEASGLAMGLNRRAAKERARGLLREFGFDRRLHERAGNLSAGDERLVGIVRALAARPRFLLLDEPAAGLNEQESQGLRDLLIMTRDVYGCGLCIVEHDMRLIMGCCERIQVLASGRTLANGSPKEIRANQAVIDAYLGAT
jgi:branched-chain amino acid transport system ATP-binding protein